MVQYIGNSDVQETLDIEAAEVLHCAIPRQP